MHTPNKQANGLLGQMYEATSRESDARFSFAEYSITETPDGIITMKGNDGLAMLKIANALSKMLGRDKTPIRCDPVETAPKTNAVTGLAQNREVAVAGNPANQFTIDAASLSAPEVIAKLEQAIAAAQEKPGRGPF